MVGQISLWLAAVAGAIFLDVILCAGYLKKYSESLLEFVVMVLTCIIAKLLHDNPVPELNGDVYFYIIVGILTVIIGVMFYHLFKVITTGPNHKKRRHNYSTPAKRDQNH